MINRDNYHLVEEYLDYRRDIPDSIDSYRSHLRRLLAFAEETSFHELPGNTNAFEFMQYLDDNRLDGKEKPVEYEYKRKILGDVRRFLTWLMEAKQFSTFTHKWIKDFKPNKKGKYTSKNKPRYSLAEVRQIARTPVSSTNEERTRAACVFMFLSGARIKAFVTLPLESVNLDQGEIYQFPSLGVETKLGKKATTSLIDSPDLLDLHHIIGLWDKKVRKILTPKSFWFAPLSVRDHEIDPTATVGNNRDDGLRDDIKLFVEKAGLEYKSPHAFRHSHIRFLKDRAKNDERELEAIAENVMQDVSTMLGYGRLNDSEVKLEINKLCKRNFEKEESNEKTTTPAIITQDSQTNNRKQDTIIQTSISNLEAKFDMLLKKLDTQL